MKYRHKLTILLVTSSLVPMTMLALYSHNSMSRLVRHNEVEDTSSILEQTRESIDSQIEVYTGLINYLTYSPDIEEMINGQKVVKVFCHEDKSLEEFNWMHEICIGFIRKNIEESTANHIVVVTHHLPTLQVVAAHHRGSVLNNAFASDYDNLIANSRIDAWIYGHSHTNIDTEIGGTRVISNQMGYIFANEHLMNGFESGKFIEIK